MALSKSLVEVGISMVLKDQFSANAGKISSSYSNLMNEMMQWNRGIQMQAGNAYEYGKQIVGGMYETYKHSAGVYNQIFMTSKIASATAEQQANLMKIAQEVNLKTPLTNMDIASGMKYMAMAGNSAEAIESMIDPAARLASIFEMQLGGKGGVADMMTNIMATFGIASKEADHVADILGRATTSANISLTDLAQSLQYSGATFRNAGVDLTSAAAAIGVLGNQGIQGSSAGTALANMYRYLTLSITGQKTKGAAMLKALGISKEDLVDSYGNLRRVDHLVRVLTSHMEGLSGTSKEAAMYNIVGVRGMRALSALMAGKDQLAGILDKVNTTSDGFTQDTLESRMKTPQGIIDTFNASLDNLKTNVGSVLADVFNPIVKGLSSMITLVGNLAGGTGLGAAVVKFGAISLTVGLIVNGFRLVHRTIMMITRVSTLANAAVAGMGTGTSKVNTQAAMLETHLRTIVALMAQYTAMAMAPGTSMVLPGGGKLGKGSTGKVYATIKGRRGRFSPGGYASEYGPIPTPKPTAPSPTPPAPGKFGKLRGLGSILGSGMMMFGGPVGLGLGLGITALSYALSKSSDSTEQNTKALQDNTSQMSAEEYRAHYEERFINAMKAAIKDLNKDPVKLNITVDGQSNDYVSGDNIHLDDFSTW